jgi:hypothetical protein
MRQKRSKKSSGPGKDPSVRRRNVKQRNEASPPDGPSQMHSDRSSVPVELHDDKEGRRRAGRPALGSSREVGDPFNTTQTNELLNVSHNKFDQVLHHVYYSPQCQYFYIGLLVIGVSLIVITIVDGFKIAESPAFIAVELILNITISFDLLCRVRLQGCKKYFKKSGWNKLDFFIVLGCNALFIVSLLQHISAEEISEELLLVAWSIAQSLRMIVIARKQQMAIRSAKTLIDFTNIGIETEVLDMQGRPAGDNVEIELEEVIVFDEPSSRSTMPNKKSSRRQLGSSTHLNMGAGSSGSDPSTLASPGAGSIQSSSKLKSMMER